MLNLKFVIIGLLSVLFTSVAGLKCSQNSDSPRLFCYYKGKSSLDDINISNCTHLIFTNAVAKDEVETKLHVDEGSIKSLSLVKEANSDLVTIFTLKLRKNESSVILESETKSKNLIREILRVLQETKFDGVELNVKFGAHSNGSKDSYGSFVKTLSKSLDTVRRRTKRNGYDVFEVHEDDITTPAYTTLTPKTATKQTQSVKKESEVPTTPTTTTTESNRKGRGHEEELENETFSPEEETTENTTQEDENTEAASKEIFRFDESDESDESTDSTESTDSAENEENKECDNKFWLVVRLPVQLDAVGKKYDLKALSKYADILSVPTHKIINENEKDQIYHPSRLMGLSDVYNTDSILDFLLGMGAVKSKIVISVPASVLKFQLRDAENNTPGSLFTGSPQTLTQSELCWLFKKKNWTLERDEDLTAPYAYSDDTWLAFEDEVSLKIKGKYILLRELAGGAIYPIDADVNDESCTKRPGTGGYLTGFLRSTFENLSRKPRAFVLDSLQEDIHDRAYSSIEAGVKLSEYRIVRVVDHSGAVHVIRRNTKTQFECSRQGYFTHPLGCNKFYRCVKFDQYSDEYTVFEYDCPAGLAFDERWEVCVWPGSLPNGSPCTGSSEIAPVPRSHYRCPSQEGYYGDPENCRWFFVCLDHARDGITPLTAYEFRCPFGLVFNEERLACDWPWIVGSCGNRGGSYLTSSSGVHTTFVNGGNLEASYGHYGENPEDEAAAFASLGRGFGTVVKGVNQFSSGTKAANGYISNPFDDGNTNRGSFASYPDYEISGGRSLHKGGVVLHETVNGASLSGSGSAGTLQHQGLAAHQQNHQGSSIDGNIDLVYSNRVEGVRKLVPHANDGLAGFAGFTTANANFVPTPLPSSTPFVVRLPYAQSEKTSGHSLRTESTYDGGALSAQSGTQNSYDQQTNYLNGQSKYAYQSAGNDDRNLESGYAKGQQYSTSLQGSGNSAYTQQSGLSQGQQYTSQFGKIDTTLNQQLGQPNEQFRSGGNGAKTSLRNDAYFVGRQQSTTFGQHDVISEQAKYLNGGQQLQSPTYQEEGSLNNNAAAYLASGHGEQGTTSQVHQIGGVYGYDNGGGQSTAQGFTTAGPTIASVTPVVVTKSTFPSYGSGPASVTSSTPATSFTVTQTTPVPPLKARDHSVFSGASQSSVSVVSGTPVNPATGAFTTPLQPKPTLGPNVLNFKPSSSSSVYSGGFSSEQNGQFISGLPNVGHSVGSFPVTSTSNAFDVTKTKQTETAGHVTFGHPKVQFGIQNAGNDYRAQAVGYNKQTETGKDENLRLHYGTPSGTSNQFQQENGLLQTQTGNLNEPVVPVFKPSPITNTFKYQTIDNQKQGEFNKPQSFYNVPFRDSQPQSGIFDQTNINNNRGVLGGSERAQGSFDFIPSKPISNTFRQNGGQTHGNGYQGIKYVSSIFSNPGPFDEEKFNSMVSFVQPGGNYNRPGVQGRFSYDFSKSKAVDSSHSNARPGFSGSLEGKSMPTTPGLSVYLSSPRPFGFGNSAGVAEKDKSATDITIEKQPIVELGTLPPVYQQTVNPPHPTASNEFFQSSVTTDFDHVAFKSSSQQPKLSTPHSTIRPPVPGTTPAPVTYGQTTQTLLATPTPLNTNAFFGKETTKFVTPVPATATGFTSGFGNAGVSSDKHFPTGNYNQASIFQGTGFGGTLDGVSSTIASDDKKQLVPQPFNVNVNEPSAIPGTGNAEITSAISGSATGFDGSFGSTSHATSGTGDFNTNFNQASASLTGFGLSSIPATSSGEHLTSHFVENINHVSGPEFGPTFPSGISQVSVVASNGKHSSTSTFNQASVSATGFESGSFGVSSHGTTASEGELISPDNFNNNQEPPSTTGFSGSFAGVSYKPTALDAKPLLVPISGSEGSRGGVSHVSLASGNIQTSFETSGDQVKSITPVSHVSFSSGSIGPEDQIVSTEAYTTPGTSVFTDSGKLNVQQIVEVTPKPVTYQESFPITGQKNVIIQIPEFPKSAEGHPTSDYGLKDLAYDVQPQSGTFGQREESKTKQYSSVVGTKSFYDEGNVKPDSDTRPGHGAKSSGYPSTPARPVLVQHHQTAQNQYNIDVENTKFFGKGTSSPPPAETGKIYTPTSTVLPTVSYTPTSTLGSSVSYTTEGLDVQREVVPSSKFNVLLPEGQTDFVSPSVGSITTPQYNPLDYSSASGEGNENTRPNLYDQINTYNTGPESVGSFGKFYAYDGRQNLTNGRVHSPYGNDIKGSINPNIKIDQPPREYILDEEYSGGKSKASSGKFGDVLYQSILGDSGSGYATSVGNQGDLMGKVSYKMTMGDEAKQNYRDEMEQLLDKYSSTFGKVINGEIYKAKLANAYSRGRTYTGASGVLSASSLSSGQNDEANSGKPRDPNRGRQYHGGIVSNIPATNKYEEYEIERENYFGNGNSESSRTSQDLRNLKTDNQIIRKPVVVVSQTSDANPILVGKLAGQCSCQSNLLELKHKGRKPGSVRLKIRKYKIQNQENSAVKSEVESSTSAAAIGDEYPSSTIGYNAPSSIYSTYQPNDVVSVTPKVLGTEDATLPNRKKQFRGRARFLSHPDSSTFGDSGSDSFLSPVLASQIDGNNDVDESINSKGQSGGAAFDRYGPGGWRGLDETLQGSIDCKRPGLFRHPKYCNKFYACNWDPWEERFTLHVFNCPIRLTYDSSISACNWPVGGPACANDNLLV